MTARRLIAPIALIVLIATAAGAEPLGSIPNPRARDGSWVADTSGTLRPETIARLNASIGEAERTHGIEMAVVVIRSLDGLSIEEAAVELFERWKIGKQERDNGLLLLWSTGDRRVRVEVGYGLEGILPDGKVGRILDAYVVPKFRAGQFDDGVVAGVDALLSEARKEPVALPPAGSESYEPHSSGAIAVLLGFLLGVPITLGSIFGVRKWRRVRRRDCPACRMPMTRLDETADDALLQEGQQAEERVGSVDYDVWKCVSCGHHFTLRYPKWFSSFGTCPQCHNRTKVSHEKVIDAATTMSAGSALVTETCAFCSFRREHTKVLPRIEASSGGSRAGGSSGGGASFGGGSSGGGGASRGY
jgi:uncharacterized protein